MSTLIAFDWDARHIRVVEASARGKRVQTTRAEVIPIPDGVNADSPEQVGKLLRHELDVRGIDARTAVGSIDRCDVVLHQMVLPAASPNELAKIIHFQVTSEMLPADQESTYDFVHYRNGGRDHLQVLIAIAASDRIERIRRVASAAGLDLCAVRFQSLARLTALHTWTTGQPAAESAAVFLASSEHNIEAMAVRDGELLASQLIPIPENTTDLTEVGRSAVSRLVAMLSTQTPPIKPDTIVLGTPNALSWGQRVADDQRKPLAAFDPFAGMPGVPGESFDALAALAGTVAQQLGATGTSMDFLHPRRPAAPHPLWKYRWKAAAAAAVLAVVVAGLGVHATFQNLDDELRRWQDESRQASAELKKLRTYKRQQAVVSSWLDQRAFWLDEYEELLRLLPDASELYLTHVTFAPASARAGRGTIRLEGYAADESTVATVAVWLAGSGRYQVRPGGIVPANRNDNYPWRFEAELALLPRPDRLAPRRTGNENQTRGVAMRR